MYDPPNTDASNDIFMQEFKLYRRLKEIDLDEHPGVIILDRLTDSNLAQFSLKKVEAKSNPDLIYNTNYGLKPVADWNCYESTECPGLFLIQNPFNPGYQRYFVKKCLTAYHCLPNKTNLDPHMDRVGVNLWKEAIQNKDMKQFNKLRWATIGYHYDWTNKVYNDADFTPVPEDVANLSTHIVMSLGFERFKPEAGIINYYHLNSTLSAHQDHSEKNMNAPLVSISFGCSGVFLIGDNSRFTRRPRAIVIKSGDIVIMSGPSRLAFHAVPKILPDSQSHDRFTYTPPVDNQSQFIVPDDEWEELEQYIRINRINLNIRQVN